MPGIGYTTMGKETAPFSQGAHRDVYVQTMVSVTKENNIQVNSNPSPAHIK